MLPPDDPPPPPPLLGTQHLTPEGCVGHLLLWKLPPEQPVDVNLHFPDRALHALSWYGSISANFMKFRYEGKTSLQSKSYISYTVRIVLPTLAASDVIGLSWTFVADIGSSLGRAQRRWHAMSRDRNAGLFVEIRICIKKVNTYM